jgi:hypothetical protein
LTSCSRVLVANITEIHRFPPRWSVHNLASAWQVCKRPRIRNVRAASRLSVEICGLGQLEGVLEVLQLVETGFDSLELIINDVHASFSLDFLVSGDLVEFSL